VTSIQPKQEEVFDHPTPLVVVAVPGVKNDTVGVAMYDESKKMSFDATMNNTTRTSSHQQQRIVLLAGPHKTGSTSMQTIALLFAKVLNKESWNWIEPPRLKTITKHSKEKRMATLLYSLTNRTSRKEIRQPSSSEMLTMYRTEIRKQLGLGLNIVLGSEEIDSVAAPHTKADALDEFLTIFPAEASRDIMSVVITYRASRIQHLISLWKELMEGTGIKTFYDFVHSKHALNQLFTIDSMSLADAFLKRGFQVYLLDLAGMASHGYEMHSVLGCDLMELPCDDTKMALSLKDRPETLQLMTAKKNKGTKKHNKGGKKGVLNVTESQLEKMEDVMRNYDCTFQGLLQHKALTVLYDNQFGRNMRNCGDTTSTSTSEMLESMQAILHA
jgi:hypothetical protein